MIDAKTLIFNSSKSLDTSKSSDDKLNLNIDLTTDSKVGNNTKDEKDALNAIDPNSFVLLLAQVLTNVPVKNEGNSDSAVKSDSSGDNLDMLTEKLLTTSPSANADQAILTSETPTDAPIDENVAVAWINSESFQALSASTAVSADDKTLAAAQIQLENSTKAANEAGIAPAKSELNNAINEVIATATNPVVATVANTVATPTPTTNTVSTPNILTVDPKASKEAIPEATTQDNLFNSTDSGTNSSKYRDDFLHNVTTTTTTPQTQSATEQKIDGLMSQSSQNSVQSNIGLTQSQNPSATPTPKTVEIPVDIRNAQWADKFSEQIVWLGNQGIKSALIKIHPEDLGPLEISIKVVKDAASVSIMSHSGQVRDIVEQALPRLKEMMSEQGLNLANVHVGGEQTSRQSSKEKNQEGHEFITGTEEEVILTTPLTRKPPKGRIDYFA